MQERRFINARLEIRQAGDDGPALIGYAALFSRPGEKQGLSGDLGGWRERCSPTAFDRALKDPNLDCSMLFNHNPDKPIARTRAGSLKLWTDYRGLRCRGLVPNTTDGKDLLENIRNGNISQMSFAFQCDPDGDSWDNENIDGEQTSVRTLRSVKLFDVSPVLAPAYPDTSIGVQVSSIDPALFGRSLPTSAPVELRSRIVEARRRATVSERRQNLVRQILLGL